MKKIAALWLGYLTLVVLSACNPKDIPAGPGPEPKPTTGEAEIFLPALPKDFLAKTSAEQADAMFILTISGPGMVPRKQAWPLGTVSGAPVKVSGIPVGTRLFSGQLESNGTITHSDSVWASIESGKTAQVNLKLARVAGNAKICVEIEGLPLPIECQKPTPVPNVTGCWSFTLGPDSLGGGGRVIMRLTQKDTFIVGEIQMPNGQRDSSVGVMGPSGWISMGLTMGAQDWAFSGQYDTLKAALHGKFFRRNGEPYSPVLITAYRMPCPIIIIPKPIPDPVPVDSALTCFDVKQMLDGNPVAGRLALRERFGELFGFFQWNGVTAMPLTGKTAPLNGNRALYLYGNLPYGLAATGPGVPDPVHYKGQVPPSGGPISFGTIYSQNGSSTARGDWTGYATGCQPKDAEIIRAMHNL